MKIVRYLFLFTCLLFLEVNSTNGQLQSSTDANAATNDVAFSPDGSSVATVTTDNHIAIWSVKTGELIRELKGQSTYMSELDWTPDGNHIVSASRGGRVQLIDADSGDRIWTSGDFSDASHRIDGGIGQVEISPDGNYVAGLQTFPESKLIIWDTQTGKKLAAHNLEEQTDVFIWGARGKNVYLCDKSGRITVWSFPKLRQVKTFQTNGGRLIDVDLKGEILATGGSEGKVIVTDTTLQDVKYIFNHGSFINRIAVSNDQKTIASVGGGGSLKLWDIELGKRRFSKFAHRDIAYYVSVSPNDEMLATVGEDNVIRFWDIKNGNLNLEIDGN